MSLLTSMIDECPSPYNYFFYNMPNCHILTGLTQHGTTFAIEVRLGIMISKINEHPLGSAMLMVILSHNVDYCSSL